MACLRPLIAELISKLRRSPVRHSVRKSVGALKSTTVCNQDSVESRFYQLLEQRKELHINDPRVYDYWDHMTAALSVDEGTTIALVKSMDKDSFLWLSEIFEDVSQKLKSKAFVEVLRKASRTHGISNLDSFIDNAEQAIHWD